MRSLESLRQQLIGSRLVNLALAEGVDHNERQVGCKYSEELSTGAARRHASLAYNRDRGKLALAGRHRRTGRHSLRTIRQAVRSILDVHPLVNPAACSPQR